MPADVLATLGASASAGMVLTSKAEIFRLQHMSIRRVNMHYVPQNLTKTCLYLCNIHVRVAIL